MQSAGSISMDVQGQRIAAGRLEGRGAGRRKAGQLGGEKAGKPAGGRHCPEDAKPARGANAGRLCVWGVVLLLVNLPLAWGGVRAGLIFLPEAVAGGQWWRVITHPLVHLSWYHLLLDAAGFLLLYAGLEEKRPLAKVVYLLGPGAGALLLALFLDPAIYRQGLCGLSGIAHGLMAIAALEMIRERELRTWGLVSLAAVTLKSAYELFSGHVLLEFMHMGLCGRPLAASHAGGVIGGVVVFATVSRLSKGSRKNRQEKQKGRKNPGPDQK